MEPSWDLSCDTWKEWPIYYENLCFFDTNLNYTTININQTSSLMSSYLILSLRKSLASFQNIKPPSMPILTKPWKRSKISYVSSFLFLQTTRKKNFTTSTSVLLKLEKKNSKPKQSPFKKLKRMFQLAQQLPHLHDLLYAII